MSQLSQSAFAKSALAAAIGIGVVVSAAACGSGQVSQTATQAPAINGATVRDGALTLNDVTIIFPTSTDATTAFTQGGPFQIGFVASSEDTVHDTELVSITTPHGTVTLKGDTTIPAGLTLRAGKPAGMTPAQGQKVLEATLTDTLKGTERTVSPGLTVPLTFTFSTDGKISKVLVDTPVDAGALMERKDPDPADSAEEGHH
ncbi:hypothetical protein [Gordonia crocea]|uniref:Putative lipoprotein LpqE n=1 Tax=Gordonia crocea TaxID=589162 RepID=A0A7I9V0W3_9ACTN|nr:hypothetical protein [Gordonia crocea]GED99035.1 putative lipoprotein LpqE [Gordonia crocea]